jgi:hypothetical protein
VDPLWRDQQSRMRCPIFPQWKQGPLALGSLGSRASMPSAVAWLARGKRLLSGALVLDRSIGTCTLL